MTAYLINHLRQPGVLNPEVLDYLDQVQATLDPFGGKFIVQGSEMEVLEGGVGDTAFISRHYEGTRLVQIAGVSKDSALANRSRGRRRHSG